MRQVGVILLLVLILIGCQTAPENVLTATSTATLAPSNTPPPVESETPVPTPLPASTPMVSPAQLTRRAGPICENSFSGLFEARALTPPFAVMKRTTEAEASSWELAHQLPHLGSVSAAEVHTVFCISETKTQTGTYTDGSPAYQLFWDVRAISWPDGRVIGRNSFTGPQPSSTNVVASGVAEGANPYLEFATWVFNQVDHPDFFQFHEAVTTLAVSPDSELAVFGSGRVNQIVDKDYQARIFWLNPSAMQIISAADGHQGMVTSLAFSPDGKTLASGGFDLFVKFWDVRTSRLLGQVHLADTPNSLIFSPDGTKLVVASKLDVAFIDFPSMRVESVIQQVSGRDLAYAPDGRHVYVNMLGIMKMIDTSANVIALSFPDPFALVPTLSVSADGSILGVTYESPESIDGFALSPAGSRIVSYTIQPLPENDPQADNVRLAIWDAKTGKYTSEVKFSGNNIQAIEFSPDGDLLALGKDSEIWIWDATGWQVKEKLTGHVGDIVDLAFTADGAKLLSAGSDGTLRLWSLGE